MSKKRTAAAPISTLVTLPLALLVAYVLGYFLLGNYAYLTIKGGVSFIERTYPNSWLVTIYRPAAWIEENLRNRRVLLEADFTR